MKLLLTSAGLTNASITSTLAKLAGQSLEQLKVAFIPTAADFEAGDKRWLIDDLSTCAAHFQSIDIVDIAALDTSVFLPRLEAADVLIVGGGHTSFLLHAMHNSGLADKMKSLLDGRVYVGISAGSLITAPFLDTTFDPTAYLESTALDIPTQGLSLVGFQIRPHLNSPHFPRIRRDNLIDQPFALPTYLLDDQSAIVVDGGKSSLISEGEWHLLPARSNHSQPG